VLLSSGDRFPCLIKKLRSQLGFVTYLLNYPRIYIGVVTGYDTDSPGFEFGEGTEIFLFTFVKGPEREAGHLHVSSDEVKNE
jgi:hypothetical protein